MEVKKISQLVDKIYEIDKVLSQPTGWFGIHNCENQKVGFDRKHSICDKLIELLNEERQRLESEIKSLANS